MQDRVQKAEAASMLLQRVEQVALIRAQMGGIVSEPQIQEAELADSLHQHHLHIS